MSMDDLVVMCVAGIGGASTWDDWCKPFDMADLIRAGMGWELLAFLWLVWAWLAGEYGSHG